MDIDTNDSLRFTYCGMGKRIKKIEKPHGQNPDTTSYAYDGMYAVCEFGGHLDLHAKYVYANGMLLARYDNSPADTHYFHHDGLGSIIGMTNEDGNVEQSYFYDDFGNSLGSWGSVSNSYLYTGQEYDDEISGAELYNLRARYYDPGVGRFVSEDPMLQIGTSYTMGGCVGNTYVTPQGNNAYSYVENNPINYIDISGKDRYHWCEWIPIPYIACKIFTDFICRLSIYYPICCKNDAINCIADLLNVSHEEAKRRWDDIDPECPDDKLRICLEKYAACMAGAPWPQ